MDLDQYSIAARDAQERHRLMIWSETSQICDNDPDPLSFDLRSLSFELRSLAAWIARLFAWIKSHF